MKTDLGRYLPNYYEGIHETDILMEAENKLIDHLKQDMRLIMDDQFIKTCDQQMIEIWEDILNISHNPDEDTEDEAFRRTRIIHRLSSIPRFTYGWLRERLNTIIGPDEDGNDQYTLEVNYATHELRLESTVEHQASYNEMLLTIYRVKPANLTFRLVPILENQVNIEPSAFVDHVELKRMGCWELGVTPFILDKETGIEVRLS